MMNVKRVKANYQSQKLPKYQGNPLVEALPCELTESELIELMRVLKPLPSFFDELSTIDATECIKDLKLVYIPTDASYQIYENVFTEIRKSYLNRNPFDANSRRLVNTMSERLKGRGKFNIEQPVEYVATAPSILVSGKAGIGKTVSIRRILSTFPQIIEHGEYQKEVFINEQVVWMSFDMQASRSRKALAQNFFNELERVLDIQDSQKFKKKFIKARDSVDQLFHAMQVAAVVFNIGLIHIDEAQLVLNPSTNHKDMPTLPEIETLFNKIGVPVIMSTTDDALSTFNMSDSAALTKATKLQTVRRLSSVAHIKFQQWRIDSPNFNELFSAYYQPALFKDTDVYSEIFKLQLLILCSGVTDAISALSIAFIRNYFTLTKGGVKVNCLNLLKQVYKARMETWHGPLSNLRKYYDVFLSKNIKKSDVPAAIDISELYDEAEAYTSKPPKKRTSAHHLKPASAVERIDEGDEVIDADSIVANYKKRDES